MKLYKPLAVLMLLLAGGCMRQEGGKCPDPEANVTIRLQLTDTQNNDVLLQKIDNVDVVIFAATGGSQSVCTQQQDGYTLGKKQDALICVIRKFAHDFISCFFKASITNIVIVTSS